MDDRGKRMLRTLLEHAQFSQKCLVEEGFWEGDEDNELFQKVEAYLNGVSKPLTPLTKRPVLKGGKLEDFTLKVAGKRFSCSCGCNVFHKPDETTLELYRCNCCETEFMAS